MIILANEGAGGNLPRNSEKQGWEKKGGVDQRNFFSESRFAIKKLQERNLCADVNLW
jgi:hypothetical protein